MHTKTWLEISSSAFAQNVQALRDVLSPSVTFCGVVKADAYGHDLTLCTRLLAEQDVSHFAVDSIDEAEKVRSLVPEATIFILGYTLPEHAVRVVLAQAIQTVSSADEITTLAYAARKLMKSVQITLEIETGLHRLGAGERAYAALHDALRASAGWVYVQSIASHFAGAEETRSMWETKKQNTVFCDAIAWWQQKHINPIYQHIACSAASIMQPETQHNLVRFGIMLYGLWSSPDTKREGTLGKRHAELKPVLSWKTRVAQVKDVLPGSGISHGPTFITNRPMRIAVLPVGYYDGLDRRASNNGYVIIKGAKCPIVGNMCMNMCMVDIGSAPSSVKTGDVVTLIGRDGLASVTADDWAQRWGTIHYEVVARIGQHIPRILVG